MKIGVITIWYGDSNYGMIWQCWALQKYLKDLGHEPYVIKFNPLGSIFFRIAYYLLQHFRMIKDKHLRQELHNKRVNKEVNKKRLFDDFRSKNISFSPRSYKTIEKLKLFPPKADCYISGSDQIWGASLKYLNYRAYFLDFGKSTTRRVAYAPSFGRKSYPQKDLKMLHRLLSHYDYVSCREKDGVDICKRANIGAIKVEDPTLLISAEEYLKQCKPITYRNYVFIYSLNIERSEDVYFDELNKIFDKKHIIVTTADGFFPGVELFGNDVIYEYATPEIWLSLIANSDLVVTSSFHGIVFSIILNRKFAFIPLKGKLAESNNRIFDLLERLEMNFAIVHTGDDFNRLLHHNYDWASVNIRLKEVMTGSKDFLDSALS